MGTLKSVDELFEGHHFDRDIIILCVRWYLRFKLSLRDPVEMMPSKAGRWRIRPLCAGCGAIHPSLRNAGDGLLRQSADHGESTRHTSKSEASGVTCTVPSIGQAGRLTSG